MDIFIIHEKRIETLKQLNLYNLLQFEYKRLFLSIINIYSLAWKAKDKKSMLLIKRIFQENKYAIVQNAQYEKKYRILLFAMCINFNFIFIYLLLQKHSH